MVFFHDSWLIALGTLGISYVLRVKASVFDYVSDHLGKHLKMNSQWSQPRDTKIGTFSLTLRPWAEEEPEVGPIANS